MPLESSPNVALVNLYVIDGNHGDLSRSVRLEVVVLSGRLDGLLFTGLFLVETSTVLSDGSIRTTVA